MKKAEGDTEMQPLNAAAKSAPAVLPRVFSSGDYIRFTAPYLWTKLRCSLRFLMILSVFFLLLSNLLRVMAPIMLKSVVNQLSSNSFPLVAIILWSGFSFLAELCSNLKDVSYGYVGSRVEQDIAVSVFDHVLGLSLRFHLHRETGKVLRLIQRGSGSFTTVVRIGLFTLVPVVIQLTLVEIYLSVAYDYYYPVITLSSVFLYVVATFTTTEWRTKIQRQLNECDNNYNQKATDALMNFETVKYFNADTHEVNRYAGAYADYTKHQNRMQISLAILNVAQQMCIAAGNTVCLMLMAYQIHEGERSVGDFVLISSFMMQLYAPLNFLGTYYRMIKTAMVDVEGLITLLNQEKDVQDDPNPISLDISMGNVEFRDVKFRYSADTPYVLSGISFVVPSGKTVAIVGSSGGGKSTIIRLLYRFYDVTEGSILLDGKELKAISQRTLRNHIAIVPQDCSLFNDTLGYNIAYGGVCTPGFSVAGAESQIRWAADKAQLSDFIQRQKDGFDTKVGERGLRLSGGEKQRVAIARALLKQPSIMCFDEATSALDTKTEREIQAAVEMVSRNRTTLMIAHRLSTVKHADQILVMKAGKIVERGTHEELLAEAGEYAEMWNQQSQEELKVAAS